MAAVGPLALEAGAAASAAGFFMGAIGPRGYELRQYYSG